MRYVSTRGAAPALPFDEVLLAGLARDGGLYLPEAWPQWSPGDLRALRGLSYPELATRVMEPFVGGTIADADLHAMVRDAAAGFAHAAVVPMRQIGANDWMMELFHGPTLAFKDVAMQLLARLFDHVLTRSGRRVTIVGATSGDTGSAAIEACRDLASLDVVILFPEGRVSPVQRRQMTTVAARNVHAVAVRGTFDDCQDLVKALFNDLAFRDEVGLSAVNSINWARVMAQIPYYVAAAVALGAPDRVIDVAVPTGNFGNVYAGHGARAMGTPIGRLVIGSNRNDILTRFFETGEQVIGSVSPTLSPSMDIQVSSNFERLLFDQFDRDGARTAETMRRFRETGRLAVAPDRLAALQALFAAARLDDAETVAMMAQLHAETGELVDPHSAIGIAAARARRGDPAVPMVAMATAHPAKFPDAVEQATGRRPVLPPRMADLFERRERVATLPNTVEAVREFVRTAARGGTIPA